jgi:deoxyribonuclease V
MNNSKEKDNLQHWDTLQTELAAQVRLLPTQPTWADSTLILGLDVQYDGDNAYVAGDFQTLGGELKGTYVARTTVDTPYQPSYFAFREGPVLQRFIKYWQASTSQKADILLIDGHGIAHPRKLGVASWLGVMLQCAAIGCAKESLIHFKGDLAPERGKTLPIQVGEEEVGVALRTQTGIKPIFVSAGHLTALDSSIDLVLRLSSQYRIPDNLRRADQYARQAFRQEPAKEWIDLGSF